MRHIISATILALIEINADDHDALHPSITATRGGDGGTGGKPGCDINGGNGHPLGGAKEGAWANRAVAGFGPLGAGEPGGASATFGENGDAGADGEAGADC